MSFKRITSLSVYPKKEELTKKLIGIGFKIGGEKEENPNIEDTIIAAAIEGCDGDYRVLSILTDWLEIHKEVINVDRLVRALKEIRNQKVRAYFSAMGYHFKKDSRFKKLIQVYKDKPVFLGMDSSYSFLVQRNGEDQRFLNSKLLVAKGTLRERKEDVSTPTELVKSHKDYYFRTLIGPSFRADMVSLFLRDKNIPPSDLARKCYGSFASAWQVVTDMKKIGQTIDV
jgi:hypothetical protein